MTGSLCAVDLYLDFKSSKVLDFTSVLLHDLVPNKISLKYFNRFIKSYYVDYLVAGKSIDDILEADEKSETIEKELKNLGIVDDKMKIIYIIFFRRSLITGSISSSDSIKETYRLITSAIYIALEFDNCIVPNKEFIKYDFDEVSKKIISSNKKIIDSVLKESINRCGSELKKIFDNAVSINNKFLKKYNSTNVFNIELVGFKSCVRTNNNGIYYSQFRFVLDKLNNEKPKEVNKMLEKSDVVTRMANINLEMVAFDILSDALSGKDKRVYVELPDNYLSKMTNLTTIRNIVSSVKNRLYLNIRYDQLIKYNNTVRDLYGEGYCITVIKGEADIDPKKLYGTKGCFIPYDSTVTFLKNVSNAKLGRVEVIVMGASGKKETTICLDKKVDYIVSI